MTTSETKVPRLSHGRELSAWPLRSHLALAPLPTAVPCARLHTRHILREWNLACMSDDTELIVSELVTNALTASAGSLSPIGLWVLSDGRRVLILVSDGSPHLPVRMNPDFVTEGGRGLVLVEAIASKWDWYAIALGKVVWAICG